MIVIEILDAFTSSIVSRFGDDATRSSDLLNTIPLIQIAKTDVIGYSDDAE